MGIGMTEDIKPISYIKTNAADMLNYINDSKSPIIITQNGEARGVMMDIESYRLQVNALIMMKLIERSENDIEAKNVEDHAQVFSDLERKLTANEQ
jgi:PHD/YefM family antitoxin component YafN of YafNO toxin-antitoxin module